MSKKKFEFQFKMDRFKIKKKISIFFTLSNLS